MGTQLFPFSSPNIELGLGVAYERRFVQSKRNLRLSLGYETQYYINQSYLMQNRRIQEEATLQGAWFGRNLAVYGITGSALLEF